MDGIMLSGFSDEICPDFLQQLQAVSELGLEYIEIRGVDGKNISELSDREVKEVKEKLVKAGIKVSSLGSPVGKIGIEEDFEPHFELFRKVVDIAKLLDTKYIRIFSFYIPEGKRASDYREEVIRRLSCLAAYAREQDVVLLHENEKQIYGDTAKRCKDIFSSLYGSNFKGVFDFANFVECGEDTEEAYEALKPYIEYIHIKDALGEEGRIVPAGEGDGKLREILTALKRKGYTGFLSLEPHLTDFTGLAGLEHEKKNRDQGLDGLSAWKLALTSLKAILWDIDWK